MAEQFTCALCGQTFEKGWSDDQVAAGEFQAAQGILPPLGATVLVCGDCFRKIGNTAGPPGPPPGPGYWMNETTGVLRPVVEAYLTHALMTPEHIAIMRAYIRQWFGSSVWDQNPHATDEDRAWLLYLRLQADRITTRDEIAALLEVAGDEMDPL